MGRRGFDQSLPPGCDRLGRLCVAAQRAWLGKHKEGKLETNFPSRVQAEWRYSRANRQAMGLSYGEPAAMVVLVAWQQPVGSIGNSAQRHLLKSLVLGQGWGLVGLLDRLIHNDTSMVCWLRWERCLQDDGYAL